MTQFIIMALYQGYERFTINLKYTASIVGYVFLLRVLKVFITPFLLLRNPFLFSVMDHFEMY